MIIIHTRCAGGQEAIRQRTLEGRSYLVRDLRAAVQTVVQHSAAAPKAQVTVGRRLIHIYDVWPAYVSTYSISTNIGMRPQNHKHTCAWTRHHTAVLCIKVVFKCSFKHQLENCCAPQRTREKQQMQVACCTAVHQSFAHFRQRQKYLHKPFGHESCVTD